MLLLVEVEIEVDSLHFLDCQDGNSSQGLVAAGDGIASALEVTETFLCHLHPAVKVTGVKTCFVLDQLTLEEHFVVRVIQIYGFILRW